jgi:hypothetical protein
LLNQLPNAAKWDERRYGRNHLLFWVRETAADVVEMVQATKSERTSEESA